MKLFGWLIPWWAYAITAALALSGAFYMGWHERAIRCENAQAKALAKQRAEFDRRADKIHTEGFKYEQERQAGLSKTADRQTQVRVIYRDKVVPAECAPDPAAVRVLDGAIADANSATGSRTGPTVPTPAR